MISLRKSCSKTLFQLEQKNLVLWNKVFHMVIHTLRRHFTWFLAWFKMVTHHVTRRLTRITGLAQELVSHKNWSHLTGIVGRGDRLVDWVWRRKDKAPARQNLAGAGRVLRHGAIT